ncbi:hypothetical protein BJ508DRAFT_419396 [Ascobolus immersus RN42]|uniref:Ubiquitin-like domain-containing protein n=1 Tax=Ascobolus immersus RN42 TaxID=1160509 RepID=A0A3N4HKF4_ASCIM|nr:hypothetical protein BJ508DRAFT_419396 [Ascobolus immersus RN42]
MSITIRIKSPTPSLPSDLHFTLPLPTPISHLKTLIAETLANPTGSTIVLIYRGKILEDALPISDCLGVGAHSEQGQDEVAFHAIVRPKPGVVNAPAPVTVKSPPAATLATVEPVQRQERPRLDPADIPIPTFPDPSSLDSPAPLQPREWRSQFLPLANSDCTLTHTSLATGLTLRTQQNQEFRVQTRRSPEGGFLLVGPDGPAAICYPNSMSASQAAPVVSVPSYTFRMRGASLLGEGGGQLPAGIGAVGNVGGMPVAMGGMGGVAAAAAGPGAQRVEGAGGAQERPRDRTNEIWLAVKLGALLWLLTDRRDVRRTVGMWVAAILIFVTQTGLLRSFLNTLQSLYTEFFPPTHPPIPATALRATTAAAAAARTAGNPDPNDLAARLLQQQQQGGIQGMYRNVERVVGLFIASLVPDVGERRVRGLEAAAAPPAAVAAPVVAQEAVPEAAPERQEEAARAQEGEQVGERVAEETRGVDLGVDDVTDLPGIEGEMREREVIAA